MVTLSDQAVMEPWILAMTCQRDGGDYMLDPKIVNCNHNLLSFTTCMRHILDRKLLVRTGFTVPSIKTVCGCKQYYELMWTWNHSPLLWGESLFCLCPSQLVENKWVWEYAEYVCADGDVTPTRVIYSCPKRLPSYRFMYWVGPFLSGYCVVCICML